MAKFTEKQILELFSSELARRLQSAKDSIISSNDSCYNSYVQGRISLLNDLLDCLEFYSTYEFD